MNVVPIPATDLSNIAAQLRKLADRVEASDEHLSCIVILGHGNRETSIYGWGYRVSGLEMQGWLTRAAFDVGGGVVRAQADDR